LENNDIERCESEIVKMKMSKSMDLINPQVLNNGSWSQGTNLKVNFLLIKTFRAGKGYSTLGLSPRSLSLFCY